PSRWNVAKFGQMRFQPFARKGRQIYAENDYAKSCCAAEIHLGFSRHPSDRVVIAAKTNPAVPDHREVNEHGEALQPYNPPEVVGQERHLSLQQNEHWRCDERNPCNEPQRETEEACSLIPWTGQELQHRKHIQSLPDVLTVRHIGHVNSEQRVVVLSFIRQPE